MIFFLEFATKTPRRLNFATYAGSLCATFQPRFSATLIGGPRQQASRRGLVGSYVAGWPESSSGRKIDRIGGFQKKFQKWKKVGLTTPGLYSGRLFFLATVFAADFRVLPGKSPDFHIFVPSRFLNSGWGAGLAVASFAAWFPNKRG